MTDMFGSRKTLRYRWEYRKLVVTEWWLRVVLRRPPAIEDEGRAL